MKKMTKNEMESEVETAIRCGMNEVNQIVHFITGLNDDYEMDQAYIRRYAVDVLDILDNQARLPFKTNF